MQSRQELQQLNASSVSSTPVHTNPLEASPFRDLALPTGVCGSFLERRFADDGNVDIEALASKGAIAFLSSAHHIDEIYKVASDKAALEPGLYRIRDEGSEKPLLTLKRHGDGISLCAETVDVVHPELQLLAKIREAGQLVAVIEKTRRTHISMQFPNCLLHLDDVEGLGPMIDVKAGAIAEMDSFLEQLGLEHASQIGKSYLELKKEVGISPVQLRMWRVQQKFADYILGIVSGTLTPLGFLSATAAGGASKTEILVTLLTVGLCDGLSDAVAASQATQSGSRASWLTQLSMFAKTMFGKVAVPCTFIPLVLISRTSTETCILTASWGAALLAATATVQALAHGRALLPAVGRIIALGGSAVGLGVTLGKVLPPILRYFLDAS